MSALTDRITEVLDAHWLHHDNRCRCDKSRKVLTGAEWRAHVAERIAALFTEEWAQRWMDRYGTHVGVECDDALVASVGIADNPGATIVHRWVSEWTTAEETS